jgi:hypothetical protein
VSPGRRLFCAGLAAALAPSALAAAPSPIAVRIADPPAGKALAVFFRMGVAGDILFSPRLIVRDGAVPLGDFTFDEYLVAVIDPGLHNFSVGRGVRPIPLQADADETYFVRCAFDHGVSNDVGLVLLPVEQRSFDEVSRRLKPAPANPGPWR